jgi:5-methylcytosine-specific restriction endonuclease McrA
MKFGKNQTLKFGTEQGSYSLVTDREYFDSQITTTDSEAELLLSFFDKDNIHVGKVKDDKAKAAKPFKLYPQGEEIILNLVFPKPNKTELRLYLSANAGFKPEPGSVWFMFVRDTELWIGGMSELEWRTQNAIIIYDADEGIYQDSITQMDAIKLSSLKARDVFARDRNLAVKRMQIENYKCEYDTSHFLFNSRYTNRPYLEAHHLVPISLQGQNNLKLDVIENIYSLCPCCHRAIHHADKDLTKSIINKLVAKRPATLETFNLSINDLFSYYSVEDIH